MEGGDYFVSTIDERIVSMKFDGAKFMSGIQNAKGLLGEFNNSLNLDGAKTGLATLADKVKGFDFSKMINGAELAAGKFIALGTVGVTALANITNRAIDAGLQLAKSLTIDPITDGLREYETNLNGVQTILASTKNKGGTLESVNGALDELNQYSDKTIYNFGEMVTGIKTLTTAGSDLNSGVDVVKGFANASALAGVGAQEMTSALQYGLTQAISKGKLMTQDWVSLETAGIASDSFKNSLIETAKVNGVAVDELIEKNGSFRDSLSEGWVTSDILIQTLQKYTGDLTDAQLQQMGYTDEQIKQIQEMAATAVDSASKIKTMGQLTSTLAEAVGSGWAKTFQILFGDLEEAKTLFTGVYNALEPIINSSTDFRNGILQDWKDLGGRSAAIEAISNAFKALMGIVTPITNAFKEIFPPATGQNLVDITNAVRDFTATLIPNEETMNAIQRTAQGLFAVLDIGWMVIKGLFGVFADLFGTLGGGVPSLLSITGNFGDFLVMIRDAIKEGNGLTTFFTILGNVLAVPVEGIKLLVGFLAGLADGFKNVSVDDGGTFASFMDAVGRRMESIAKAGGVLTGIWQGIAGFFSGLWAWMQPGIKAMGVAVQWLGDAIRNLFENMNWDLAFDGLNSSIFIGLLLVLKKFLLGGGLFEGLLGLFTGGKEGFMDSLNGTLGSIGDAFESLTGTMSAMQAQLNAGTLMKIALAIGLLTLSVIALSFVDSEKLTSALSGISVMIALLVGSLSYMNKMITPDKLATLPILAATMILLSIAIAILTSSVMRLAELDWNELARGTVGIAALLAALVFFANQMEGKAAGMFGSAVAMTVMALAIKLLVSSVTDLGSMSWESLIKGIGGLTLMLYAIFVFTDSVKKQTTLVKTAASLAILGTALKILASALKDLGSLDADQLTTGLVALASALAIIAGSMKLMPKDMLWNAVGLLAVSAAVFIMAQALQQLGGMTVDQIVGSLVALAAGLAIMAGAMYLMTGSLAGTAALIVAAAAITILVPALISLGGMSWDEIGRGLVMLAGSLLILAGGLYLMTAALPGAAALLIAAAALTVLLPVVQALGNMTWDQVWMGMGALAVVLGTLALAGIAILPAIPGLLLLGTAILVLGVGALAAGMGVLMLSAGLLAIAAAGSAAGAAIGIALTALIEQIPALFTAIGMGIIAMAQAIGNGASALVEAFVQILQALIDAINLIAPQIIDMIWGLVMKLIDTITTNLPLIVDAGLSMITGILDGIASNIEGIVTAATNIIVNFINGISNALPRIIQSGVDLVISFVEGLAQAIRNNTERMNAAGADLADAIIDGMVSGINNGVQIVSDAISDIAGGALDIAKKILGIASPSKEFTKIGMWTSEGFANGIARNAHLSDSSISKLGNKALTNMKYAMGNAMRVLDEETSVNPTITPVLDLSKFKSDASSMNGLFSDPSTMAAYSSQQASAIENERSQAEGDDDAVTDKSGVTLNFTQNNTSPKAIDTIDTYRNTKNQISSVKGMVDSANAYADKKRR